MNKKIALFILVFIFPILSVSAQKMDEITLKSGSVIRGSIIEIIPEGKVTINDLAGNTWVFKMTEIEKIKQIEEGEKIKTDAFLTGWGNMTSIGFLAGSNTSNQIAPFSLISSFGYKNELQIYTGFATGIEFLNINHIPVLFDLQYFTSDNEVSTVFILRGGYALPTSGEKNIYGYSTAYMGGVTGSMGVGLKIKNKEKFAWDVNVLYRYMQIKYTEYNDWSQQDYQYTDIYNRLELRLGFYLY
ncbi:MAG: hypothetical protein K9H49_12000 [Bacteroidales bacterium]|nr:hypothetical protein [Bacteroidales bacterium]MCF8390794.1 hypothetical protein [Bacteroidales bacterium]